MAAAYNAQFDPPAWYAGGQWIIYCNATAPDFNVTIGGKTFTIDKRDQIISAGPDAPVCYSGTQGGGDPSADNYFIL